MTPLAHSIRTQRLSIQAASEEIARALLPRLEDIQQQRIVPVIEEVLDELSVAGLHVELGRLEIDLGTLPFSRFEEALAERLRRELRRALGDALRTARESAAPGGRTQPEGASWLDLMEHYLLHGTLPFWAPEGISFSFEALLLERIEHDPGGVARLLHRHRGRRSVLERLVAQLGGAALARLLHALDPEGAALILAYLIDLRSLHRAEPVVELGEELFGRALWVLTLTYVLRDPGTHFNRKSFVLSLLEGLSVSEGLPIADLFEALRRGLDLTERHRPLSSSLPAVIGEILADLDRRGEEEGSASTAQAPPDLEDEGSSRRGLWELLEHLLLYGTMPAWARQDAQTSFEALVQRALESDPGRAGLLIRRHGRQRRAMERIARELGEASLRRLLHVLEPEGAALIVAYLIDLREVHRAKPLAALGDELFGRRLWVLALTYVMRDPGTQWNRKSFARSLLVAMAESEAVDYADLLATVRLGLERTESHRPLSSSLPAVLRELTEDLERERGADAAAWPIAGDHAAAGSAGGAANREAALALLLAEDGSTAGPWSEEALLEALRSMPDEATPELLALGARHVADDRVRERWSRILPEPILARLLAEGARAGASTLPGAVAGADAAPVREAVLAFLLGEGRVPAGPLSEEALFAALRSMLDEPTPELSAFLARHAADDRVRARWSKILPEAILVRVSAALAPRNHRVLIDAAELLSSAWIAAAPPGQQALRDRPGLWRVLLEILSRHPGADLSVEQLTLELFEHLAVQSLADAPPTSGAPALGQTFLEQAERLAGDAGNAALTAVLRQRRETLLASFAGAADPGRAAASARPKVEIAKPPPERSRPRPRAEPFRGKTLFGIGGQDATDDLGGEPVLVDDAGLVLTGPFLPRLFGMLDMLGKDGEGVVKLRDPETASRAVHLLRYLADGRTDAPEPVLVLAKVLCGVPSGAPAAREIELTPAERTACEGLLRSVVANWPILGNTSIAGLRETFLRREGKLTRADDRWLLRVQRKTVDVLVDQIPWSISVLYHPWMSQALHVTW